MNAITIYYYEGDPATMVKTHGYGIIRTINEDVRMTKYRFGIFRKDDEPTYSTVDMQTGYRYKTPARTIHEAKRFVETIDLKEQPILFEPAWKQVMMIRAAYENVEWKDYFWNPENPNGFNQPVKHLDPDKNTTSEEEK